jgi:MFS family permease
VQGLAGGLVYGTAPGLVTRVAAPGERGRALGALNAAIGLAYAGGPLVAGVLVDTVGWRSIFHLRVPLAALTLAIAFALPGEPGGAAARRPGRVQLLRGAVLRPGVLAFCGNAGIFAVWLLAPFYLVSVRGLDATVGGVLFMLTPLGTAVAAPLAGRAADRVGPWPLVVCGLALEALGLALLGGADAQTPLPALAAVLFGAGLGLGVFQVPNMAAAMAAFGPAQQGTAGGFIFFARTLGTVFGVATLAQIFAARRVSAGAAAFGECFLVAAAAVGAAAALAAVWARRRS